MIFPLTQTQKKIERRKILVFVLYILKTFCYRMAIKNFSNSSIIDLLYSYAKIYNEKLFGRIRENGIDFRLYALDLSGYGIFILVCRI